MKKNTNFLFSFHIMVLPICQENFKKTRKMAISQEKEIISKKLKEKFSENQLM